MTVIQTEMLFLAYILKMLLSIINPFQTRFRLKSYSVEPLGADTIVELTLGTDAEGTHTILKACTAPNFEAEIGEHLYVTFVAERMHFFDETTGNALNL